MRRENLTRRCWKRRPVRTGPPPCRPLIFQRDVGSVEVNEVDIGTEWPRPIMFSAVGPSEVS